MADAWEVSRSWSSPIRGAPKPGGLSITSSRAIPNDGTSTGRRWRRGAIGTWALVPARLEPGGRAALQDLWELCRLVRRKSWWPRRQPRRRLSGSTVGRVLKRLLLHMPCRVPYNVLGLAVLPLASEHPSDSPKKTQSRRIAIGRAKTHSGNQVRN
jgi:hypothetical protein